MRTSARRARRQTRSRRSSANFWGNTLPRRPVRALHALCHEWADPPHTLHESHSHRVQHKGQAGRTSRFAELAEEAAVAAAEQAKAKAKAETGPDKTKVRGQSARHSRIPIEAFVPSSTAICCCLPFRRARPSPMAMLRSWGCSTRCSARPRTRPTSRELSCDPWAAFSPIPIPSLRGHCGAASRLSSFHGVRCCNWLIDPGTSP